MVGEDMSNRDEEEAGFNTQLVCIVHHSMRRSGPSGGDGGG